jgi:acyl dehydratase
MIGRYFEDIEIGLEADLGHYDFTRDNVLAFARRYDPQPFHIDDQAAAASHFGRLAASGWHTAAGWMKCYVETNQRLGAGGVASGPSPGFTELKWPRPVYPGDRVRYATRVTAKRELTSRPEWGLIFSQNAGVNQHGETVFGFAGKVLVRRRGNGGSPLST